MRFPKRAPSTEELINALKNPEILLKTYQLAEKIRSEASYMHWDQLQHREAPEGFTLKEWWLAHKLNRYTRFKKLTVA